MTTPYLLADIKADEGCRLAAYPDRRTGGAPWTIGYGHTGREVHPGLTITQDEANALCAQDVGAVQRGLDTALPWWRSMCDARQDVIVNMAFNMGLHGLLGFPQMLAAAQAHDYQSAAAEMLNSAWAAEVQARAQRLADQMGTGERARAAV